MADCNLCGGTCWKTLEEAGVCGREVLRRTMHIAVVRLNAAFCRRSVRPS